MIHIEDLHKRFVVPGTGAFKRKGRREVHAVQGVNLRAESGRVVTLSSVVGEQGNAGQAAYAASKAGLIGFSKALARELASREVTVNVVAPGFIETDMTQQHLQGEARQQLLAQIPLGRIGQPEEVAAAVAFLASLQASYITGQVLRINGGLLIG